MSSNAFPDKEMPPVTKADLNFGDIQATLDVLRLDELRRVFEIAAKLCDISPLKSVKKMDEGELRECLSKCARTLHDQNPDELERLASSLDAIRKIRFKKLFEHQGRSR